MIWAVVSNCIHSVTFDQYPEIRIAPILDYGCRKLNYRTVIDFEVLQSVYAVLFILCGSLRLIPYNRFQCRINQSQLFFVYMWNERLRISKVAQEYIIYVLNMKASKKLSGVWSISIKTFRGIAFSCMENYNCSSYMGFRCIAIISMHYK